MTDNVPLIKKFGLDWMVEKRALKYQVHGIRANGSPFVTYKDSRYFALVRVPLNPKEKEQELGVCTDLYTPIQNFQILELAERCLERVGLVPSAGMALDAGRKIYLEAVLPKTVFVGQDEIQVSLYLVSSHDGTFGNRFGLKYTTLSDGNIFYRPVKKALVPLRHTRSKLDPSLPSLFEKSIYPRLQQEMSWLETSFQAMSLTPLEYSRVSTIVEILSRVKIKEDWTNEVTYSVRRVNLFTNVTKSLKTEMSEHGENCWGAFNGVVSYFTFLKYRNVGQQAADKHNIIGYGNKKMNEMFSLLSR